MENIVLKEKVDQQRWAEEVHISGEGSHKAVKPDKKMKKKIMK